MYHRPDLPAAFLNFHRQRQPTAAPHITNDDCVVRMLFFSWWDSRTPLHVVDMSLDDFTTEHPSHPHEGHHYATNNSFSSTQDSTWLWITSRGKLMTYHARAGLAEVFIQSRKPRLFCIWLFFALEILTIGLHPPRSHRNHREWCIDGCL